MAVRNGKLRAGVIGAGAFGRLHAQKYSRLDDVRLVGIADPDQAKAAAVAEEMGCFALGDYRRLIGAVDVVTIASPALTHGRIALDFLASGVSVLVEKPLAASLAEADQMIRLAEQGGLVLGCGHQERYVAAEMGLLGRDRPRAIECVRVGPYTGRGMDVSVVLDLMIHDLDLVHQLNDSNVTAVAASGLRRFGTEPDAVDAQLVMADGCEVRLLASRMADQRRRSMRLVYDDGVIEVDFTNRTVSNTTPTPLAAGLDSEPGKLSAVMADPLGFAVARFVEAVAGGRDPLVRPREARRALDTALRIGEALRPKAIRPVEKAYAAHVA